MAVGAIINWGLANSSFFYASATAVVVLSGMAALYCSAWIGQISDFKALNNAKFKVLNEMAPLVIFGDAERDKRVSYCPFEREWNWLKDAGAAQQARSINVIALRSTNIEYIIPRAFRAFFILVGLAVAIEVTRKLLVLP